MSRDFSLSIAQDHIRLEVVERPPSFWGFGKPVEALRKPIGLDDTPLRLSFDADADNAAGITTALAQGLKTLALRTSARHSRFARPSLEVRLGSAHSHVGVAMLDEQVNPADRAALITAWAMQTWNISPDDHIIRFGGLPRKEEQSYPVTNEAPEVNMPVAQGSSGNSQQFLVSCINQSVFNAVARVCAGEILRFVSCTPALLSYLPKLTGHNQGALPVADTARPDSAIAVIDEPALGDAHGRVVQFVVIKWGSILSITRQWVQASNGDSPDLTSEAQTIEQNIARLCMQYSLRADSVQRIFETWPSMEMVPEPTKVSSNSSSRATTASLKPSALEAGRGV